jgi:hypothetical protein
MTMQIGTKIIIIDGREHTVRVFESRESAAARRGRRAAIDAQMDGQIRREAMADTAHYLGHSSLSEPHSGYDF